MQIEILGTESLGVRGLSCLVEAGDRKIVIDPGLALGYNSIGLQSSWTAPAPIAGICWRVSPSEDPDGVGRRN
jgi:hypothetical protein